MGQAKKRKKAKKDRERLAQMMVYSYMYCTDDPNYSEFLGTVNGATAIDVIFDDLKIPGKRQEAIETLLNDKIWNSIADEDGYYYSLIEDEKMLELDKEEEEKTISNLETRDVFSAMAKEMDRREMEEPQKHWSEIRKEVEEEFEGKSVSEKDC